MSATDSSESIMEESLFQTGMWWRMIYGIGRIIFGLSLFKVVGTPLADLFSKLMSHELIVDKDEMLITFTRDFLTRHPVQITYFLAGYFIFWGTVDAGLSYNLMKHRLWAFPVSMALASMFIGYGFFRVSHTHSSVLLLIIFLDIIILLLMGNEYWKLKNIKGRE